MIYFKFTTRFIYLRFSILSILPKLTFRTRFLVAFEVSSNQNKLLLLQERSTTTSSKQ